MTKLLAHARSYGIELFCPGFPGAQATQVGLLMALHPKTSSQQMRHKGDNTNDSYCLV